MDTNLETTPLLHFLSSFSAMQFSTKPCLCTYPVDARIHAAYRDDQKYGDRLPLKECDKECGRFGQPCSLLNPLHQSTLFEIKYRTYRGGCGAVDADGPVVDGPVAEGPTVEGPTVDGPAFVGSQLWFPEGWGGIWLSGAGCFPTGIGKVGCVK